MSRLWTSGSRPLPAELSLAAACCRWPLVEEAEERIRAAAKQVDWGRFEGIVGRNRIAPLVHHALGQARVVLPEPMAERLSRRALAAARQALTMARETLRLQRSFEAEALQVMVLKGAPLAVLAYGELGMKESWDIDLLVSRENVAEAIGLLTELGYENSLERLQGGPLDGYLLHTKEAAFLNPQSRITAELHWGLVDNRRLLRGVDVHSPAQTVAIPGGWLRTLADEELIAYLCVHGATHNWGRLKWLADLGAMLDKRSEQEIEGLYRSAERLGAGRSVSVALMLCQRLLGIELGDELLGFLRQDPTSRALERNVLAGLAHQGGTAEHVRYTAPWLRTLAAQFFLAPGAHHAMKQAQLVWNSPVDRTWIILPRRLSFLYHLLRVPLWLGRVGSRALRRILAVISAPPVVF